MDKSQNKKTPSQMPDHVPTDIEIARAEAEAARAIAEGRAPAVAKAADQPAQKTDGESASSGARSDFVPYVDDVEAEERARRQAEAEAKLDAELGEDTDYVPSELEKRVAAIPEDKWKLYQIVGGAVLGAAAAALLFIGNGSTSMMPLLFAALLVLVGPNLFERNVRRKIPKARVAMVIALIIGLAVTVVHIGVNGGFKQQSEEAQTQQEAASEADQNEAEAPLSEAEALEAPEA